MMSLKGQKILILLVLEAEKDNDNLSGGTKWYSKNAKTKCLIKSLLFDDELLQKNWINFRYTLCCLKS